MPDMKYRFQHVNPYDVIARLIQHLRQINSQAFLDKPLRDSIASEVLVSEEAEQFISEHREFDDGNSMACRGIPEDAVKALENWEHYREFLTMLAFLSALTRRLSCDIILASPYLRSIGRSGFPALNENYKETSVYLLPKFKTINDPVEEPDGAGEAAGKKWADERLPGINAELANMYYIEARDLSLGKRTCSMRHYVLNEGYYWEGRKRLILGVAPVVKGDMLAIRTYDREQDGTRRRFFAVKGLRDEGLIKARLRAAFLKACQHRVQVLLFPEMLGSAEIVGDTFFRELCEEARNMGYFTPMLTLAPTWWHDGRNELHVKTGGGRTLLVQEKYAPFPYKAENGETYLEDLAGGEHCIHVLHVPELGRIVFPICRDLLTEDYLSLLVRNIRATLLICPSFSSGKTQFDLTVTEPVRFGCYTIWANTCAAFSGRGCPEHIGLVSGPQTGGRHAKYFYPRCEGNCGGADKSCVFFVDIAIRQAASFDCRHECPFPRKT